MKNNNQDFFMAMGAETIEKTDTQMLFLYLLEIEINKEIKELQKEAEDEKKGVKTFYFDHEDEDPLE